MNYSTDFIDYHRAKMGLSREEYTAYYLSAMVSENKIKTFEQFSLNEEDKSRSDGFIPATLRREFEDFKEGTEISVDALDYSNSGKDDLVVSYVDSSDEMIRIPKGLIELEDGEGI